MKYLPVSIYDTPEIARWLEEEAAAGRQLKGFWGESYARFQKTEPVSCRYYLEPQLRRPVVPDSETREAYAAAGWEYVCGTFWNDFYVWRSIRPDPEPLHTDPETEGLGYGFITRALKRKWALLGVMLAIPLLFVVGSSLYYGKFLLIFVRGNGPLLINWLWVLFLLLYLVWITAGDLLALRRVRRRLEAGVPLERASAPRRQRRRWSQWGYTGAALLVIAALLGQIWSLRQEDGEAIWTGDLPCLDARELGAVYTEREEPGYQYRTTPLAKDLLVVVQGGGHMPGGFSTLYFDTETCFYRLRPGFLAGPVLRETVHGELERREQVDMALLTGHCFDRAWYGAGDDVQCFAARRGDCVITMRTDAPEDLRDHLDELSALFEKVSHEEASS